MKEQKKDVATLVSEYHQARPTYEVFTEKLYVLIQDLLQSAEIKPQSIEHRTKTVDSFAEKIQREGKSYRNPLDEITDLFGIRIILYTVEDVESVCKLVEDEFEIDKSNSIDKGAALRPNEFGYPSVHYVMKLGAERLALREYRNHSGKKLEIQVRTVLQHAWAAIDHRLRYKSDKDAPEHLRRRLFLLSGLLEMADREFSELVLRDSQYAKKVSEQLSEKDLDFSIDLLTVEEYLSSGEAVKGVVRRAREAGLKVLENIPGKSKEEYRQETLSELIYFCNLLGLRTIKELDDRLRVFLSYAQNFYRAMAKAFEYLAPTDEMILVYAIWILGVRLPTEEE